MISNQSTEPYRIPVNSFVTKTTSAKTLPLSNKTTLKPATSVDANRSLLKPNSETQSLSKMATLTPILSSTKNIAAPQSSYSTSFTVTNAPAIISKQNPIPVISTVPVISMVASLTNSIKGASSTPKSTLNADIVVSKSVSSTCATSDSNISSVSKTNTLEISSPCARIMKRRLSIVDQVNTEREKSISPPKVARILKRRHSVLTVSPICIEQLTSTGLQRQSTTLTNPSKKIETVSGPANTTTSATTRKSTMAATTCLSIKPSITCTPITAATACPSTKPTITCTPVTATITTMTSTAASSLTTSKPTATATKSSTSTDAVITIDDDDSDIDDENFTQNSIEPKKRRIRGYFISNLKFLGKLPAEIGANGVTIKYENRDIRVDKPSDVNTQINRYVYTINHKEIKQMGQ